MKNSILIKQRIYVKKKNIVLNAPVFAIYFFPRIDFQVVLLCVFRQVQIGVENKYGCKKKRLSVFVQLQ